jgi:hypothetical protein
MIDQCTLLLLKNHPILAFPGPAIRFGATNRMADMRIAEIDYLQ